MTVPAVAGSLLTFMYFGAGLWAMMNATVRRYTLALPARAVPFALACLAFPAAMALAGLAGENRDELPRALLPSSAFLFVPLFIARYRPFDPVRSLAALYTYAPLGAAGGLAIGLVQVFRDTEPTSGGAGNSAVYGTAMVLLASLSLAGLFQKRRWLWAAAIAGFTLGMAGVLLSQTRTLYPLLILLPLLLLLVNPSRKLLGLAAVTLAFGVVLGVLGSSLLVSGYQQAFQDVELLERDDVVASSIGLRAALWSASLEAYAEMPLLGYGPQNKMDVVAEHMDERVSYVRFSHVHNGPLDAAVAAGTVGVVAFFSVMLTPLVMVFGRGGEMRERRFIALSTFCIFGLSSVTGTPFEHDLLSVLFLLPLIVVAAADPDPRERVFWRGRRDSPRLAGRDAIPAP